MIRKYPDALTMADELDEGVMPHMSFRYDVATALRQLQETNEVLLGALQEIAWSKNSKWQAARAELALNQLEIVFQ